MGWKKMIFGEKMPDKEDPKYKNRYQKEVEAGRKAARFLRIDKAAGCAQRFACRYPKLFLGIVFGIVIGCLALNVYRIVSVCQIDETESHVTATQRQELLLKQKQDEHDNRQD